MLKLLIFLFGVVAGLWLSVAVREAYSAPPTPHYPGQIVLTSGYCNSPEPLMVAMQYAFQLDLDTQQQSMLFNEAMTDYSSHNEALTGLPMCSIIPNAAPIMLLGVYGAVQMNAQEQGVVWAGWFPGGTRVMYIYTTSIRGET